MRRLLGLAGLALLISCSGSPSGLSGPVAVDMGRPPARMLSELALLAWDGHELVYNDRVVPYDMNTPLFSDFALKRRAIYIPEGASATYTDAGVLDFPVGTALIKTFLFADDLREPNVNVRPIETRLLIRYADGWEAWPYIWDEAGGDAHLAPAGDVRVIEFIDRQGAARSSNYLIPQRNQCQECHERKDASDETFIAPIGPSARNLNRTLDFGAEVGERNQLEHLAELGMLGGLPPVESVDAATDFWPIERDGFDSLSDAELETAARDYLDVNCAHCHNPRGVQGITSQLFLNWDNDDVFHLGACKRPGSAGAGTGGHEFDIVPGDPDLSILIFRVETDDVGAMMPLIGRSLVHDRGAALLREWIARMPADDCGAAPPAMP